MNRRQTAVFVHIALTLAAFCSTASSLCLYAKGKKIVFVAGRDSHGYGAHEFSAGSRLLAEALEKNLPGTETSIHHGQWPEDSKAFDGADAVVLFMNGGGGHLVNRHLDQVDELMKKGVGLACLHYAVEVPKGKAGNHFLDWIGGYFEVHWSVNPTWVAEITSLPEHPITRGVKPFKMNDEWYYHMRFRPEMEGVTPILSAIPPASTLSRPDGPHSGNKHVRAKIGEPQHLAWARERPNGGRGFGFTGGHFHWNWADDSFRKVVLNGIAWIAKAEIPSDGIPSATPTREGLAAFIQRPAPTPKRQSAKKPAGAGKPKFSKGVTASTPGHAVDIDVDIRGAKNLYLSVTDGGDGYSCDWADWIEPRLVGPNGEKKLTELRWKSASSDWGSVQINKNAGGGALRVGGKPVAYGIGTHANSLIAFELPQGYTRFKARGGLDNGGTDQGNCGRDSSVEFAVYTAKPKAKPGQATRDPADAVGTLDVHEGLEATLFASEPTIRSPTNLDIDARGRVWVCEVINYRRHNGKRPEGDRILILEDTNGDGVSDTSKVYYQGRDIDSAMGICVLGNKLIVSASPNIFIFHDDNGDDKPDRKEVLFSKTGSPQHDHSAHSFIFGPDGKLYWNFGNTGRHVHDRDGNLVVDKAGNRVVDNGKPYFGGMVFRCNADGSEFEVLGHNFRNNYEVTVDSFGTLWQSDNDDDGNRGVRINYVMEFGNFGYRDEITGAGWNSPRTGMHKEVPKRHWHLNDPGVVPNLLQTGSGSPCGIAHYEGTLLPRVFHNQMIHAEPGHNVVRAYPVKGDGAGYTAEVVHLVKSDRDRWFRPADVCVAPDGSVFITDWYDPGVGGHGMGDLDRGRIYRIAPPNHRYRVPKLDLKSAGGATAALQSPSRAVRYLAWQALQQFGRDAEEPLKELARSETPHLRARALWLLGKTPRSQELAIDRAARDDNEDVRTVAIRLARQVDTDLPALLRRLVNDPSPRVRRECTIALRELPTNVAAELWTTLANQHVAGDRWNLEALGIAADSRWDELLSAWLPQSRSLDRAVVREIIWRSRGRATPALLAQTLREPETDDADLLRHLRAFDFLKGEDKRAALLDLAGGKFASTDRLKLVAVEALRRVDGLDIGGNAEHRRVVDRVLENVRGTPAFVDLAARFKLRDQAEEVLQLAKKNADNEIAVKAIRYLFDVGEGERLAKALAVEDVEDAKTVAKALGTAADQRAVGVLQNIVVGSQADVGLRREAAAALTRSKPGAQRLLELAKNGKLDESVKFVVSVNLHRSRWGDVRAAAENAFPLPAAKDAKPLPPISKLLSMKGDAQRGAVSYREAGTCATCHRANNEGKEVGPDLSDIGSKLSREALYESILYPSAAISHNYEAESIALNNGEALSAIVISETPETLSVRGADAIVREVSKKRIVVRKKDPLSLMPADLHKNLTPQDLADLVEYLLTLKKKS